LLRHLGLLKQDGFIEWWFDEHITPGGALWTEIEDRLRWARIFVLLISADSLSSPACKKEREFALDRASANEATVIPVIVRPSLWDQSEIRSLKVLPTDGKPITGWRPQDSGYLSAARGIRLAVEKLFAFLSADPKSRDDDKIVFNNLPTVFPAPFVGREAELAQVKKLLSRARLVVLQGFGGTGKTRLALQAAVDLARRFRHGVCRVSLDRIQEPGLVLTAIARELKLRETETTLLEGREAEESPVQRSLKQFLETKQMLLVLDSFEHVAASGKDIVDLLDACPSLKVLVTSRSSLNLRWGRVYDVPFLEVPARGERYRLADLARIDSVALFLQSARAVQPDFQLTTQNASAISRICQRLEGVALAIKLAGARVRRFTPGDMLLRLDRQLKLLVDGAQGSRDRHLAMEAAILWSYDLLKPGARHLLQCLSIFKGGCTLQAATAVCCPERGREGRFERDLEALLRNNLLWQEPRAGEDRFRMLDVVREFGLERLKKKTRTLQRRHAEFFAWFAERAEPDLTSPRKDLWLDRLEIDHDNLRAALEWCLQEGETELALGMAGALFWFWNLHAHFNEGRILLERALKDASPQPTLPRARALYALGGLTFLQGEFQIAFDKLQESASIFRTLPTPENRRRLGYVLTVQGMAALSLNNVPAATQCTEESVEIFESLPRPDPWGRALALNDRGNVFRSGENNKDQAMELYQRSHALWEQMNDSWGLPLTLSNIGFLEMHQDQWARAHATFQEALRLQEQVGDRWGRAETLKFLADVAVREDWRAEAVRLYRESLLLNRDIGRRPFMVGCIAGLAVVGEKIGKFAEAARLAGAVDRHKGPDRILSKPLDHALLQAMVERLDQRPDAKRLRVIRDEGASLPLQEAVDYALKVSEMWLQELSDRPPKPPPDSPRRAHSRRKPPRRQGSRAAQEAV
jgi:non-specific serine/threonine protein kinase